jgi:hypothetical protein
VRFAQHDQVVDALSTEGADHAFRKGILPGRSRRDEHFIDAHVLESMPEVVAIDPVSITEQVSGLAAVRREGLDDLLGGPLRRRVIRDVEVEDASIFVRARG